LVVAQAQAKGITLEDFVYEDLHVSPLFNRVTLEGVEAKFDLEPKDNIRLRSSIRLQTVEVHLRRSLRARGDVAARGIEVRFDSADLPPSLPYGYLFDAEARVRDLPLADPRQAFEEVRFALKDLFKEGWVKGEADFSGKARVTVNDAETVATIYTERKEGRFRLRVEAEAVRSLARQLDLDLAEEQVEIASTYPLRMPVIMRITDRARDVARDQAGGDFWLEDAMRHVFWSFLLTERFGPESALLVTDAQEMRPGNTPDERDMDFHNNAVGRKLSAEGLAFDALPQRVRTDPGIIRDPAAVDGFRDRLLR
ncbi:MAG TPA: hypothetical protein VEY33_04710, partial [Gemmatimonadota bacterium]|nr:hypothetical protein [Gemmatimonadota bacterium]